MREKIYISAAIKSASSELAEFNRERIRRIYARLLRAGYNPSHAPLLSGCADNRICEEVSDQEIKSSGRVFAIPCANGFISEDVWRDVFIAHRSGVPVTWFRNELDVRRWLNAKILTFTGASGVGKTTIVNELVKSRPEDLKILTSITTREPSDSDLPGEYRYVTKKDILRMRDRDEFLWLTDPEKTHGNYYGTTKQSIKDALSSPHRSIMLLVPEVLDVLYKYTNNKVWSFYILSPTGDVIRDRLKKRGRESDEEINKRIHDCKRWDEEARKDPERYTFINNNSTISKTIESIYFYLP